MSSPPSSKTNKMNPLERRYYRFATPIAILAFLVSCASAAFTLWQATLIRESNEMVRANNVVSQRAFVNFTLNPQQFISSEQASAPGSVNFIAALSNSGNTPTKNLEYFYKCVPAAEDLVDPWSVLYQGREKIEHEPQFIGGHGSIQIGCSFTMQQIGDMAAKKLYGYLMLDASYFDRLDAKAPHKTQASFMLTQVSTQSITMSQPVTFKAGAFQNLTGPPTQVVVQTVLINRGKHNCADEECPADPK